MAMDIGVTSLLTRFNYLTHLVQVTKKVTEDEHINREISLNYIFFKFMEKAGCIAYHYKICMTPNIHTTHLLFSHCFQMFLNRP